MNFPPLKNRIVLDAALGRPTSRVPVWVMRQAGRYLPEFRALRKEHEFFKLCQTPELACEVTLQPIKRFDLDAAIIFSDILVIPQALGMTVEMKPEVGPFFPQPLKTPTDIDFLQFKVDVKEKLNYVFEAITLTRYKLDGKVPLIGFSGAPWTLMSYMIEGGGSRTMSKSKSWLYRHPKESHFLLKLITDVVIDYLVCQVKAGAQMLQLFESHAEHLNLELFHEFALPYIKRIRTEVEELLRDSGSEPVPMIIFAKGGFYALKELEQCKYEIIGLDWTVNPLWAKEQVVSDVTFQGNMDPCALYGSQEVIESTVQKMLEQFGVLRYIANLGHGIYPDVEPSNLAIFIDSVHRMSEKMIKQQLQEM